MNRLTVPADSTDRLRRELRDMHHALEDLAKQLASVELQTQQLTALRESDRNAADRMDRLERVLDLDRVATHVRDRVRRTGLIEAPVPHAIVTGVLPEDTYEAAIDAIPSHIFFEPRGDGHELPVPPMLAPTHCIATWMFLADVVKDVFVPALVERFEEPLDRHVRTLCPSIPRLRDAGVRLTVSRGRIVLRQPGDLARVGHSGPWDWLTVVLYLARAEDGEDYGSMLRTSDAARAIPFRGNTALTFFHSTAAHDYVSIPGTALAGTERYACEFRIGPDKKTRRRLEP